MRQRKVGHSKTGDFLEEVQFIWMWNLNIDDYLIEVTLWAGLIVLVYNKVKNELKGTVNKSHYEWQIITTSMVPDI